MAEAVDCLVGAACCRKHGVRFEEKERRPCGRTYFGKLWLAAEVILFVLVGAAVDIRCTLNAGIAVVGIIFTALLFRAVGVAVCLIGTPLTMRERVFCIIAYLPKATVQAAIGSVPLSMGLPCGSIVLSVAVPGILITVRSEQNDGKYLPFREVTE